MLILPGESVYEGNWDSDMSDGYARLVHQSEDIYDVTGIMATPTRP